MRIKLDYPLTMKEISDAVGAESKIAPNKLITYVSTDSRETYPGDLFIALKGEKYDGERFVADIIKKGAYALTEQPILSGISVLNTGEGLLNLASYYKTRFKKLKHTVAITGSVGKTTTKEFLRILLNQKYSVHSTYKNRNNLIGVPLTLLSMPKESEALVVEIGMNHFGEISAASKCIRPNTSLITNVGTSHIGNLGSREAIAKAKLEILDGMNNGVLIVPKNEPLLKSSYNSLSFDLSDKTADLYFDSKDTSVMYYNSKKFVKASFFSKDYHLRICLAASALASIASGLSDSELARGIMNISKENIRQKIVSCKDFYFFSDLYNASYESMTAAFDSLERLPKYQRKSILIGDILELGDKSEEIHRELGKKIASYKFYNIYLFGNYSKYIYEELIKQGFPKERIYTNENTENIEMTADQIKRYHTSGEIILIKASRGMHLERILQCFDIKDQEF